ncbi:O-antigen polymerase [Clostridium beijerinckii]|uniref:O-antigen polymerase n=1 Tax=Clostridium beijerinckii TaxID=1520 RepID=UPI001F18C520|nr:O-antigen polymerase [Clostridium beijerinckii]
MIIFIVNYILVNRDICAPSSLFCLSFLVCSFFTTLFSKKWGVNLEVKTYAVIVCGVLVFCITSFFINMIFRPFKYKNTNTTSNSIKRYKLIFLLVFQLVSYILIFMNEKQLVMQYGHSNSGSISDIIYGFRALVLDNKADLNPIISLIRRICNTSAYIWGFLISEKLVNKIEYKKNVLILLYINFIVSLLGNMLDGQRGNTIAIILSTTMMAYIMWNRKNNNRKKIKIKSIIKILILFCMILLVFQGIGTLLGRISYGNTLIDYIGIYIGAEIANLNIVIQSGITTNDLFGRLTFHSIYLMLGVDTAGVEGIGFQYSNGYQLGNVYTVFKDYLLDFGYIGYLLPVCFISLFSTIFYLKIKNRANYKNIDIGLIILSQVLFAVVFSFFSNKFGEIIFSKTYISYIISVILLKIYLYDIFFENYKLIIKRPKKI